jgi:hypothetical protein
MTLSAALTLRMKKIELMELDALASEFRTTRALIHREAFDAMMDALRACANEQRAIDQLPTWEDHWRELKKQLEVQNQNE